MRTTETVLFRTKQTKRKHETTSKKESDECLFIKLKLHDINEYFGSNRHICSLFAYTICIIVRLTFSHSLNRSLAHNGMPYTQFLLLIECFRTCYLFFVVKFFFLFNSLRSFLLLLDESGVYISDHWTTSNQKKDEKSCRRKKTA